MLQRERAPAGGVGRVALCCRKTNQINFTQPCETRQEIPKRTGTHGAHAGMLRLGPTLS